MSANNFRNQYNKNARQKTVKKHDETLVLVLAGKQTGGEAKSSKNYLKRERRRRRKMKEMEETEGKGGESQATVEEEKEEEEGSTESEAKEEKEAKQEETKQEPEQQDEDKDEEEIPYEKWGHHNVNSQSLGFFASLPKATTAVSIFQVCRGFILFNKFLKSLITLQPLMTPIINSPNPN